MKIPALVYLTLSATFLAASSTTAFADGLSKEARKLQRELEARADQTTGRTDTCSVHHIHMQATLPRRSANDGFPMQLPSC